jgi:ATP-dependent RNA helicase RhlE
MEGRDLLGCAQTGTGKTAAFAIPILQKLSENEQDRRNRRQIRALILAPTRELAIQIRESFQAYGRYLKLKTAVIYGGVSQKSQTDALTAGVDILIATPGRMIDLMNQGYVKIHNVEMFVLDEATSSVDTETEHLIQEALNRALEGRTSFIIAHRLSTIRSADRILVIDKGRIIEEGSHKKLIRKKGYYYRLYTNQLIEEQEKAAFAQ